MYVSSTQSSGSTDYNRKTVSDNVAVRIIQKSSCLIRIAKLNSYEYFFP